MNDIIIAAAKRTPTGAYLGQLAAYSSPQLATFVIRAMLAEYPDIAHRIDECLLGCVLTAGVGQAPARQAVLEAGLPDNIPCTTVNKVCGSGMKTLAMACDSIQLGYRQLILAGGMESMSNAAYLVEGLAARKGLRIGHKVFIDHMFYDGLENYKDHKLMGCFAERTAGMQDISRQQQDQFATQSLLRARDASEQGRFKNEIVAIDDIFNDEQVFKSRPEKIPTLKPAFSDNGSVTAANSSSISDGAAVCLLASESAAQSGNLLTLGYLRGHSHHAQAPEEFTTAIPAAIEKLLKQLDWKLDDVDLFEINEAFAVVALSTINALGLDSKRVNVNGGACAIGHPIGASGCRIVVTLLHALRERGLHKGIAAVCIGGGESMAVAVEV